MLKINHTETGVYIEQLTTSLEEIIAQRVLLAVRLAQPVYAYPDVSTILLGAEQADVSRLEKALAGESVLLSVADQEAVELTLEGTWIASHIDSNEGTLIADLNEEAESLIVKLWVASQAQLLNA